MTRLISVLLLLCGLVACQSGGSAARHSADTAYYAQHGLRIDDRGNWRSTNYQGASFLLVPINTELRVLSSRGSKATLQVVGGSTFTFEHIPRHTRDTRDEAFRKAFGIEPVDLSTFSDEERQAIEQGKTEIGMTRKAVLLAIGPPPAVGTLSLDAPAWKYWSNRWATSFVRFDGKGCVTSVGK